jgi:eukaryotic-like serine/threonine-protein kinase
VTVYSTAKPTTPSSTPTTPTTTSTTTTSTSEDDADLDDAGAFINQYYDLLPEKPEEAWARLTPKAQGLSGGKQAFFDFYAQFDDVRVQDVSDSGNGQVRGTVLFSKKNGGADTREPYRFTVINQNGQLMIDDFRTGAG